MDKTKAKEKIQGILCPFHGAESDLGETQQGGWSLTAKELENLGSLSQLDAGSYSQDIPAGVMSSACVLPETGSQFYS